MFHYQRAPTVPVSGKNRVSHPLVTLTTAALGLVALVPLLLLLPDREGAVEAPATSGNPVFGLYAPGTLNELPPSAGRQMLAALNLQTEEEYQDWSLALVRESGAGWVRIDFRFTGWSFDYPDYLLNRVRDSDIETVGCIRPINSSSPADLGGFESGLRQLIQRHPWIRVWQIGNEPDLGWDNPEDFSRLFLAAAAVVREECPDCRVALPGAAALFPGHHDAAADYDLILGAIARDAKAGERPPFDILDLHFYGFAGAEDDILASVAEFRALLSRHGLPPDTALWVTENATPSGQPVWPSGAPYQSAELQAAELARRFTVLLGAGTERVSWARPYENFRHGHRLDGFFDSAGLVYNGLGQEAEQGIGAGVRKPSFYAYQTLAKKLDGYAAVDCLAAGQYRFRFNDGRPPLYILWNDQGGLPPAELAGPVTVINLYGESERVDAGTIRLEGMPVMVEP